MKEVAESLLQPAINLGLSEWDFWEMTVAEVQRYLEGAEFRLKAKTQLDYTLADLIGLSIGRLFSSDGTFPPIEDIYPSLYPKDEAKEEEVQQIKQDTQSVNNFLKFAQQHNRQVMRGRE